MKNYINLINPTFYQIKIFINVLGFQLIKFSQNYFLSAFNILSLEDNNLNSIRSCIIKNFIKITKYFTQGVFDGLLKNQIITHGILYCQYNEEQDIKNEIDYLSKNKKGIFFLNILGAKSLYVKLISGTNFINILSI